MKNIYKCAGENYATFAEAQNRLERISAENRDAEFKRKMCGKSPKYRFELSVKGDSTQGFWVEEQIIIIA